jgi:hypothetical protein
MQYRYRSIKGFTDGAVYIEVDDDLVYCLDKTGEYFHLPSMDKEQCDSYVTMGHWKVEEISDRGEWESGKPTEDGEYFCEWDVYVKDAGKSMKTIHTADYSVDKDEWSVDNLPLKERPVGWRKIVCLPLQ